MSTSPHIRVGCQSWGYDDWITKPGGEPVFYPRGTKSSEMLEFYSTAFDTIEVDSTAYGPPTISTITGWYEKSTPEFKFSLKVPRLITHELSLGPASYQAFDEFVERAEMLREKLAAILIQLPAVFESTKENAQAVRAFVERLPSHLRFALEFRHPGWFIDWTFEELEKNNVALALVEGKWVDRGLMFQAVPKQHVKLAYVRFMGIRDLQVFDRVQRPQDEVLELWAQQIAGLKADEVWIYTDNYLEGFAPATANKIKAFLDLPVTEPAALEEQPSLF